MKTVAIIGSGIAGLACAHQLRDKFDLTMFEQSDYIGGHTNTVDIREEDRTIPVDTGFMVFNSTTYPILTALFDQLDVPLNSTDMSFSLQLKEKLNHIEWCGSSLNQLFGQRKNIFSPRFLKFIFNINRFNKLVERDFDANEIESLTISEYVRKKHLDSDLLSLYLIPMASAIWSSPPDVTNDFPAHTLLRFFHNHRLHAGLNDHLKWLTVKGGAKTYVDKLLTALSTNIRLDEAIIGVKRNGAAVQIQTSKGNHFDFDFVIVATHADQALAMIKEPTELEKDLLMQFTYSRNCVLLHTDASVMPITSRCWASWNFRINKSDIESPYSIHYWMNNLQNLASEQNYFVSLNSKQIVSPDKILKHLIYEHPIFTLNTIKAQKKLPLINLQGEKGIYFCGSYFGYGFHEDALKSALDLCSVISKNENV